MKLAEGDDGETKKTKGREIIEHMNLMNHRTVYYAIIESSITDFCCCFSMRLKIKTAMMIYEHQINGNDV